MFFIIDTNICIIKKQITITSFIIAYPHKQYNDYFLYEALFILSFIANPIPVSGIGEIAILVYLS